jgi:hypothetical protein
MSLPTADAPADPAQAQFIRRLRLLMALSGIATFIGIAVVLGVIGYRVFRNEGSVAEVTALLPKGARVTGTQVAGDRLVVTLETVGTLEVRTFDLHTLRPAGRLKFATEP